jgi:hypothetical protein
MKMNTLKTLSALLLLSACTAGCADGTKSAGTAEQSSTSTDTSKALPSGPTKSATPVTADELLDPRGGERSADTSEYGATDGTYRLYGVDGDRATIAELGTWTTRQYEVGDSFGRGLVVAKIGADGVTLHGAHADVTMAVGADVNLRVIRHELDVVAQPLGKHRFRLSTPAAQAALDTNRARPSVEAVTLYDQPMEKLGAVPASGLWAATDFRAGDLIATVDGKPADADVLSAIETGLTDGRRKLDVTIYRGGVAFHRSYEVDAVR